MTEQIEILIPYDDLKYVSVKCTCGTEVTIDISPRKQPVDWEGKGLACTFCTHPFDSALKAALANLAHWYSLVKDSGLGARVCFRVKKT